MLAVTKRTSLLHSRSNYDRKKFYSGGLMMTRNGKLPFFSLSLPFGLSPSFPIINSFYFGSMLFDRNDS